MVWGPFVVGLGSGGDGFPADGRAGRLVFVAGVVAELGFNVPPEVEMGEDLAGMKLDAVQRELGKAGGMDAAGVGVVDKGVAASAVDDGGLFPAFGEGSGGVFKIRIRQSPMGLGLG